MFRDCCFEYAGVNSSTYNLVMLFMDNDSSKFNSGAEYEPIVSTIPCSAEQLLYEIKHNEKPLSFDIEIFNPDGVIPLEQTIEIKNWLFGQDGWKTFRTIDERQDYYLKCLILPKEDIVDGLGVRGFSCTIQNVSGFWYKDKTTTILGTDLEDKTEFTKSVQVTSALGKQGVPLFPIITIDVDSPDEVPEDYEQRITIGIESKTNKSSAVMSYYQQLPKNQFQFICYPKYTTFTADSDNRRYLLQPTYTTSTLLYFEEGNNEITLKGSLKWQLGGNSFEETTVLGKFIKKIEITCAEPYRLGGI